MKKSAAAHFALNIFADSESNRRLEGIGVDPLRGDIYVVKEKSPRGLYKLSGLLDERQALSVTVPWDMEKSASGLADLSGVFFDAVSQRVLVLGDESSQLGEYTHRGELVARLALDGNQANLAQAIPQAEGITLTREGDLYIVSEPNLLYRFVSRQSFAATRNQPRQVAALL